MASESQHASQLLTAREAAGRLRCSLTTVYALIGSGALPVVRVGKRKGYRIDARDVDAFIDERRHAKQPRKANGVPPRPRLKHIRLQ